MRLIQTISLVLYMNIAAALDEKCNSLLSNLEFEPPELVIKYGDPVSVNCSSLIEHTEPNWILPPEYVFSSDSQTITWNMDTLTDWELEPQCSIKLDDLECNKTLPLTIYKLPDMVSISMVDHTGPVFEGMQYELQCDVQNVAPVHHLTVNWYKGETLVESKTVANFSITPVNQTFTLQISPGEADNEYMCEAVLNLGPKGPDPPPTVKSDPFIITVVELSGRVSIKAVGHMGPMIPYRQYELQCDVQTMSPVHNLTVNWYKEETLVEINVPDFSKTQVNQSFTLPINSTLADNGIWYMCEAVLNLGPKGPDPPPTVRSDPFIITVDDDNFDPITVQPQKVAVEYGTSTSANCSANLPHEGMGWEVSQGNWEKTGDGFLTWRVENVTEWSIKPMCYINIGPLLQYTVNLNVTVYKLPDLVSISSDHSGPMTVGSQYKLQCYVQNIAPVQMYRVHWYKGETIVHSKKFIDPSKNALNRTLFYKPNPSTSDDEVQYSCEAVLNLGPDGPQTPPIRSNLLTFTVYYKPVISCSEWSPMVNTNLESYPHMATGKPPPKINWFQGKFPVNSSKRLDKDDSGNYELVATNEVGDASCTIIITVEYGPTFDCPSNFEGKEHDPLINCVVLASPEAEVTWYKNGKIVNMPNNLTREDSGLYKITASNKHGREDHFLNINVFYGPSIKPGPDLLVVKKSKALPLQCIADGNPAPNVSWSFQNQTWDQKDLHLKPAIAGDYTCTATNEFGSDTRRISLMVADSSSISSAGHNEPMIEHRQYSLQCDVQNVPSVHFIAVKWYKNETTNSKLISSSEPPLLWPAILLFSPKRTDNGAQYWCEAELKPIPGGHHSGPAVRSDPLFLTVLYRPKIKQEHSVLNVTNGDKVTLHCRADGNPKPDVWWSFKQTNFTQGQEGTLTISRATFADGGEYTCTALNKFGSDKIMMSLKVQETSWKYIIMILVILLILILLLILICWCLRKKRSGKYDVRPNDAVLMKPLNNGT